MKLLPIDSVSQVNQLLRHNGLEVLWPFCIWLIASAAVITNAYFHRHGYLTFDSIAYLRQADFLVEGLGLYSRYELDLSPKFFATWPIGYPFLIAATAFMFNITPFWASKFLNLILIAVAFLALRGFFGRHYWVAALFFLSGGIISIFSHTWSEGLFIVAELCFVLSLIKFLNSGRFRYAVYLFLSMVCLFLARYIGIFVFIVIMIECGILFYRRDYRRMLTLATVGGLFLCVVIAYFYYNYKLTGHITGTAKSAPVETIDVLAMALIEAQVTEFNFVHSSFPKTSLNIGIFWLMLIVPTVVIIYWLKHHNSIATNTNAQAVTGVPGQGNQWRYFLLTGLIYWIVLVLLRFTTNFDIFNYRLLGPSSILFYLALLSAIKAKRPDWFHSFAYVVIGLAVVSSAYNVIFRPLRMLRHNEQSFVVVLEEISRKYQDIPSGSLVICGNKHLQYLRLDLITLSAEYDCKRIPGDQLLERYGPQHQGPVFFVQEGVLIDITSARFRLSSDLRNP